MIRAVLFDFGGVLTEGGKKGFVLHIVAELYGLDPKMMDIGGLHLLLRRGEIDADTFFERLNEQYGGNVTVADFAAKALSNYEPSKEVYQLAEALRKQGIRTGILSNIFEINAQGLRKAGCYDGFDPVLLSCEVGTAKPEEKFYEVALERLELPANQVLFIDDQEKCIPPARAMGMHTIVAVSPKQIVRDAKALLARENKISL